MIRRLWICIRWTSSSTMAGPTRPKTTTTISSLRTIETIFVVVPRRRCGGRRSSRRGNSARMPVAAADCAGGGGGVVWSGFRDEWCRRHSRATENDSSSATKTKTKTTTTTRTRAGWKRRGRGRGQRIPTTQDGGGATRRKRRMDGVEGEEASSSRERFLRELSSPQEKSSRDASAGLRRPQTRSSSLMVVYHNVVLPITYLP